MPTSTAPLTPLKAKDIKAMAYSLGFEICRILPAQEPRYASAFRDWLDKGMSADMDYLARSVKVRTNPLLLEPQPKSVLVLAARYPINAPSHKYIPQKWLNDQRFGWIARYAWGPRDYHKTLRKPLIALDKFIRQQTGRVVAAKGWTDSGPVLERDLAEQAGIGFIGKNTCAIHSDWGSWFFLASLWLPEVLDYDEVTELPQQIDTIPQNPNHNTSNNKVQGYTLKWTNWQDPHPQVSRVGGCGSCVRCIQSCPTNALTPYQLDARLCIAYWTIEAKKLPPAALAKKFGRWIFGCDICQDVCPWNSEKNDYKKIKDWREFVFPNGPLLPLAEGFDAAHPYWLDDDAFLEKFKGTPIMRSGRLTMLRNVNRLMEN